MGVMVFHDRMAELWRTRKARELTKAEYDEMAMCLEANANWAWKLNKLNNLSLVASMTNDYEWLHEICARIEALELTGTEKKPGPRDTGK